MARTRIWMMDMTEAVIHLPFYGSDGKRIFKYEPRRKDKMDIDKEAY